MAGERELDGLETIAEMVMRGEEPQITGRQLLGWFEAERRGSRIVGRIRSELRRHKLKTEPDFNDVWVDIPLRVKALAAPTLSSKENPSKTLTQDGVVQTAPSTPEIASFPAPDAMEPVHRIGRLEGVNKVVVSVPPSTPIGEAITLMMLRDFSQLPIIQNERSLKGAVSWRSIGVATALGQVLKTVNDCMGPAEEVSSDQPVLDAISKVVAAEFVLVRGPNQTFQGIITAADLSLHFRGLSEPFLLLGQIENMIRALAARAFTLEEMKAAKNPADASREINDVTDLSFGEYVRLLEPSAAWPKLKVTFQRGPFLIHLKAVQDIRNDVMHFDPDPLGQSDLAMLRNFTSFLDRVVRS